MRSTSRCADCWTFSTLLALPDPASSGRDRALVVSLRRVLFSFVFLTFFLERLFVRIETYQCESFQLQTWVGEQTGCCHLGLVVRGSSPLRDDFFYCDISFFLFECKNMYDHWWWLKCHLSNREVSFICIHSAAAAVTALDALCLVITVVSLCVS